MPSRTNQLETAGLILTPLRVGDAEEMVEVLGDPSLYAFIGGHPPTLDELAAFFGRLVVGRSADGAQEWHNWIVRRRSDGRAVGTLQATVVPTEDRADIAWVIGAAWQGQGFATEAARALIAWLRSSGVGTIAAHVHPDHDASAIVAARAGLAATGEMDDGEQIWRSVRAEGPPPVSG